MACPDSVYDITDQSPIGDIVNAVKCLKKEISSLEGEFESLGKTTKSFATDIGGSFGSVKENILGLGESMVKFTTDTKRQYDLAKDLAEAYKSTNLALGLSVGRSKEFSDVFKESVANIAEFGGEISDAQSIFKDFIDESGRSRIINPEDVENIFLLQKTTGMVGSESAKMYEMFDLMGKSLSDVNKEMETLIKDSQSIGLNSSKVINTLANNLNTMQTYSFVNGVKGMTEMAKQAVKMRLDVSDILGMSEKFYQPEAAIEAAAQLQLLGGDIASAFGDPFTVMYEARNKPEELAKRVQNMTENMIQFNEESGQYELPAEARMQLKAVGDQLGININNMVEMSRQTAKMKDVKMELSDSELFTEEQMEGIASMAKMTDEGFKVDLIGDDGKRIEKNIKDLTSGEVEMLLRSPKDEEDYMEQMVYNSMTTNEILESIRDQFEKSFVATVDVYEVMEELSKGSIKNIRDLGTGLGEKSTDKFDDSEIKKLVGFVGENTVESLNSLTENFKDSVLEMFGDSSLEILKKSFDEKTFEINSNGVININTNKINTADQGKIPMGEGEPVKDFLSRNDGTVTSFSNMDDIIGAKNGGPIDKLLNSVLPNNQTSVVEVKGNPKIDININSNNPNMNFTTEQMEQITNVAMKSILSIFNNGGSIDGGNQSQNSKGFEQNLGNYKKT